MLRSFMTKNDWRVLRTVVSKVPHVLLW